jgi:hypothetical protein
MVKPFSGNVVRGFSPESCQSDNKPLAALEVAPGKPYPPGVWNPVLVLGPKVGVLWRSGWLPMPTPEPTWTYVVTYDEGYNPKGVGCE